MFLYLVLFFIFLVIVELHKRRDLMHLYHLAGSAWRYIPVIGQAYICCKNNEGVFKVFIKISKFASRSEKGVTSVWMGNQFFLVLGDPVQANDAIKSIHDKTFVTHFMSPVTGNGSAFAPGEISHRRRKIFASTFTARNIYSFVKVFEENASMLIEKLDLEVGKINHSPWNNICLYALDSVGESVFGIKIDALKQPSHQFSKAFQDYFKNVADRTLKPWLYIDAVYKLFPVYKRQNQAKKVMYDFVDNIIQSNIAEKKNNVDDKNPLDNDLSNFTPFLKLIIQHSEESGKRYTPEELREETLILLLAATDTSSTAICFSLLLLSQHQDIQEKVFEEINEVFGDTNKPIACELLSKLKYLEAVIKEVLRLYPPIPILIRDSDKEFVLSSGLKLPKRCNMFTSVIGLQRDSKYWGDDVEDFKPERFLEGGTSTAYLPFGTGPRRCPGNLYAMLLVKSTLVTILRRYRLFPATSFVYDKNNPMRVYFAIMTKHVHNYELRLERRFPATA